MDVENANIIKAPRTGAVSESINELTTLSTLGTMAQDVATSDLAPAAIQGSTVISPNNATAEVYIGQYALTPKQLEQAGVIKPGSSNLVQSLVAGGAEVKDAMPPSIFTGKSGARNFQSLIRNIPVQSEIVVKNMQVAQTSLQNAGIITGTEAPSEINGLILSATNNGLDKVIGALEATKPVGAEIFNKQPLGKLDATLQDITAGNRAGKLAERGLGTLSGVETALQSLAKTPTTSKSVSTGKGLEADAFETIKNSIPDLLAGVPNDLTAMQKQKAQQVQAASNNAATNVRSQAAQGLAEVASGIAPQVKSSVAQGLINLASTNNDSDQLQDVAITARRRPLSNQRIAPAVSATGLSPESSNLIEPVLNASTVQEAAQTLQTGVLSSTAASMAAGLNNLPGGLGSVASVTDFSTGLNPELPGTTDLKLSLENAATDALNNIQTSLDGILQNELGNLEKFSDTNGLVSLVSSKLPAGPASLLQNALGSIASSGLGQKAASVGINTIVDRLALNSGVKEALDDPAIPAPNYGEVSKESQAIIEKDVAKRKEFTPKQAELTAKYEKANKDYYKAYGDWLAAAGVLPQGDPSLAGLKARYEAEYVKRNDIKQQLENLYKEFPELSGKSTASTSTAGRPVNRVLSGSLSGGAGGGSNSSPAA